MSRGLKFIVKSGQQFDRLLSNLEISKQAKNNLNKLIYNIFGINITDKTIEIIKAVSNQLGKSSELSVEVYENQDKKEKVIDYGNANQSKQIEQVINLCIIAGLPTEQFIMAEELFKKKTTENREEWKLTFKGDVLGGAFAQYVGIMAESELHNYQVITKNSMGIKNFIEFKGNEFLGYEYGLLYFLRDLFNEDNNMEFIRIELEREGVIKNGNIGQEFRSSNGDRIDAERIKEVLIRLFTTRLKEFNSSVAKVDCKEVLNQAIKMGEVIEESFNPYIIERKMRFIDSYQRYKARTQEAKGNIINYITADNIPARLLGHVGSTYVVDENLWRLDKGKVSNLSERISKLEKKEVVDLTKPKLDLFEPFILTKEGGSFESAVNRLRNIPQVGNLTNNVSRDYLRSLIKDIILDFKTKDEGFLKELFRLSRLGREGEIMVIIKDRLRHSMYLQKKLDTKDSNGIFKSRYLRENQDLLTEEDRIYQLAKPILKQLNYRMGYSELTKLWDWKITGSGQLLILGNKLESNEEVKGYHASDSKRKFTNEEVKLKIELEEPSQNKIYGTHKTRSNYKEEYDTEYRLEEENTYQFKNTQGIGATILSKYTNPERKIKIDKKEISGVYNEVDEIEGKVKVSGEEYYGSNIIYKPDRYELIYLYGPEKKDKLIIDGFKNGDYGIELKPKVKEAKDTKEPMTYTPHRVKIDPFEFKILDKLEINKSIYDHTRVKIAGMISDEDLQEYERYLDKEDPKLVITYDNQDNKILFKGIIENYRLDYKPQEYYLELEAVSYSVLLERKWKNRIYQNFGTTYGEVFDKLMDDNPLFHITFADDSLEETSLVSKDYPLVLQYKENEWDFLKRIASYLNQLVIVDDTKDDEEKITILLGFHTGKVKDLNNIAGIQRMKSIKERDHIYPFYQTHYHAHFRSDEIFDIGKKVNYRLDNETKETVELIIIKNRIYMEDSILRSDLSLVKEEEIDVMKRRRKRLIKGKSLRAEVKKVNQDYTAQVEFLDIEDDYNPVKAFRFPIDKFYTNAYFAPEVGDVVDIYFKSKNEKYATSKSSSTDNGKKIDHDPADKLIKTPGGFQLLLNNQEILLAGKDKKASLHLMEEELNLGVMNGGGLEMTKDRVRIGNQKGQGIIDDEKTELSFGKRQLKISKGGISLS